MEVILLEKVGKLGGLGDKVNVKAGYGRNYLFPYGKAVPATGKNLEEFEARRAELEKAAEDALSAAETRGGALEGQEITITAKASDEGRLFGSIGTREIADAITATGNEIAKSEVLLPEGAFRELGQYEVKLQLHSDVTTAIQLIIAGEE